ncbi:MAG: SpoIIE family protein phosphatase [Bacteroidetes bacterium]|nr:SpoIIE family protein phosphatase [Bacteroidota bacterium]
MKIGVKLTLTFFLVAMTTMVIIGVISFRKSKAALTKDTYNNLLAVRETKEDQLEDYFSQLDHQVHSYSDDPTVIAAARALSNGFNAIDSDLQMNDERMVPINKSLSDYYQHEFLPRLNKNLKKKATESEISNPLRNGRILQSEFIATNPQEADNKCKLADAGDGSSYSAAHKQYHNFFRNIQEHFGYHDVYLVDSKTGVIIYSVEKEIDFGTSLIDGPFKNTNLANVFKTANNSTALDTAFFADFKPYRPAFDEPNAFIATTIYDGSEKIGVLIFSMPLDEINDIMTNDRNWDEVGLGETGEGFIVGDDFKTRNQSRLLMQDSATFFSVMKEDSTPEDIIQTMRSFNTSIGMQTVHTTGVDSGLAGKDGLAVYDNYRHRKVFSSYGPIDVEGVHWMLSFEINQDEALENVYELRKQIILASSVFLLFIALISFILGRQITKPITLLTEDASELATGNFDVEIKIKRKDEIGILAVGFKKMQVTIRKMIEELRHINANLEQKVEERTEEINNAKAILEHKNKEILDSINYALRLQTAILPPVEKLNAILDDSFVLFKPKDIVSGDFYWMKKMEHHLLIAAVDCTGHGVPGALVSMVGSSALDRCVGEFHLAKPSDILDKLRELVIATFETKDHDVKDGMDIAMVSIRYNKEKTKATVEYSGANNPLWLKRKNSEEIEETKADKQPIGVFDFGKPFTNHTVEVHKGDCIYLFTDGYADQFGGPAGKKFRYKTLKNLLQNISNEPMSVQGKKLDEAFEQWRGELSQIDDVCVIGVRI